MSLAFEVEQASGVPLVAFRGELDGLYVDRFESAMIAAALDSENCVIADLSDVTYIDSQSFGRLLKVHVQLEKIGGDVAVVASGNHVSRIIKTLGGNYLLAVFDDRESAAEYLLPLMSDVS
jgi:anti-anti-sigma factor